MLTGFPSVGKSTILTVLTGTKSEAAAYEFTTLTCIPGIIHYNDAKIQLLDLPGIIEGAAQGKGRAQPGSVSTTSDNTNTCRFMLPCALSLGPAIAFAPKQFSGQQNKPVPRGVDICLANPAQTVSVCKLKRVDVLQ